MDDSTGTAGAPHTNDPATIRRLMDARGSRWAVVGLTPNPALHR